MRWTTRLGCFYVLFCTSSCCPLTSWEPLKIYRKTGGFFSSTLAGYSVNNPPWYFVSVGTYSTAPLHETHTPGLYNIIIILLYIRCSWGEVTVKRGSHWSRPSRTRVLWMKPARFLFMSSARRTGSQILFWYNNIFGLRRSCITIGENGRWTSMYVSGLNN